MLASTRCLASLYGRRRLRVGQVEAGHRGDDHRVVIRMGQRLHVPDGAAGDHLQARGRLRGRRVVVEQVALAAGGVLLVVGQAVQQRVQRADPGVVGALQRLDTSLCETRVGGCADQRENRERRAPRRARLPPSQIGIRVRLRARPRGERIV
jgi:hypothetical protein